MLACFFFRKLAVVVDLDPLVSSNYFRLKCCKVSKISQKRCVRNSRCNSSSVVKTKFRSGSRRKRTYRTSSEMDLIGRDSICINGNPRVCVSVLTDSRREKRRLLRNRSPPLLSQRVPVRRIYFPIGLTCMHAILL